LRWREYQRGVQITIQGNGFDLTSEGGARLEGNLTAEASAAPPTLDDGGSFTFTADLTTGVAGLYDVVLSDKGRRCINRVGANRNFSFSGEHILFSALVASEPPCNFQRTSPEIGLTFLSGTLCGYLPHVGQRKRFVANVSGFLGELALPR
jgi:hypothetical protein